MEYIKLENINEYFSQSINPMNEPDRVFEVYSVPSFETGHPEYLRGDEIASSKLLVEKDDILLCKINPRINRVWVVADESDKQNIASSEWIVIRNKQYNPEFLAWYFRAPRFQQLMISEVTGIGGSLTRAQPKRVSGYPVPVLDKRLQDQIAQILNLCMNIISNRQKQLKQLDILIKARFVEMFGDMANPECQHSKCKLAETCRTTDDIKCGPFGTQLNKDEYQTEGIAVWEIPQINSGFIEKPIHFLTKKKAEQLKAYSIEPGDIAMSRKGNVGKCGLFPENYESGIIHSDVLRIRIDNNRFNPCFIMHQLHYSRAVQRQIQMVSSGAIMAGINVTKLKQIEVHIPPLELQNQFATFVQAVDKSKVAIQKSLDETQLLFDSLMQEYFG